MLWVIIRHFAPFRMVCFSQKQSHLLIMKLKIYAETHHRCTKRPQKSLAYKICIINLNKFQTGSIVYLVELLNSFCYYTQKTLKINFRLQSLHAELAPFFAGRNNKFTINFLFLLFLFMKQRARRKEKL